MQIVHSCFGMIILYVPFSFLQNRSDWGCCARGCYFFWQRNVQRNSFSSSPNFREVELQFIIQGKYFYLKNNQISYHVQFVIPSKNFEHILSISMIYFNKWFRLPFFKCYIITQFFILKCLCMEQHIDNYFKCNIIKHYSNSEKQTHCFFHGMYQLPAENLKKKN